MRSRTLFLLAVFALAGGMAFGQVTNARIIGTVMDNDGNVLPGVVVEATSPKLVGKAAGSTYPTVESFWYFLLTGDVPTAAEVKEVVDEFKARSQVPQNVFDVLRAMPRDTHPMTMSGRPSWRCSATRSSPSATARAPSRRTTCGTRCTRTP